MSVLLGLPQNYCFKRKFNNKKAPIIAGNKKLTDQISVLKQMSIKLLSYQVANNTTINCPLITKSVKLIAGMILKHKNITDKAIHNSKIGTGIENIFTAQIY